MVQYTHITFTYLEVIMGKLLFALFLCLTVPVQAQVQKPHQTFMPDNLLHLNTTNSALSMTETQFNKLWKQLESTTLQCLSPSVLN